VYNDINRKKYLKGNFVMSKFTFICEEQSIPFSDSASSKRTVEFNTELLDQILNEFEHFLRGCGFHFNGQLDFVNDEEQNVNLPECYTEELETTQFELSNLPNNNWPFGEVTK
jgi:hypothetical protein